MLTNETITFGKYKGAKAALMLRDRSYCEWLLNQDWFKNSYEFLYNCVKDWNPTIYFLNKEQEDEENTEEDFMSNYIYFNLTSPESLMIELSSVDMTCYVYYISMIDIKLHYGLKDNYFYNVSLGYFCQNMRSG